ncbi:MAG: Asp23/Gls24 family envelope stress response protein [Clostridiales bacterium]|nr:Asp23/Gls24 family envelope stress response protein [Clostridiales bacterium]
MVSYFKKIPSETHEGKVVYSDGIIDNIVILAVSEVEGVDVYLPHEGNSKSAIKSVKVRQEKDGVYVDVAVVVDASLVVPDIAFKVQENVKHNVEAMTEYHIAEVNVIVKGVTFNEDRKEQRKEELEVKDEQEIKEEQV